MVDPRQFKSSLLTHFYIDHDMPISPKIYAHPQFFRFLPAVLVVSSTPPMSAYFPHPIATTHLYFLPYLSHHRFICSRLLCPPHIRPYTVIHVSPISLLLGPYSNRIGPDLYSALNAIPSFTNVHFPLTRHSTPQFRVIITSAHVKRRHFYHWYHVTQISSPKAAPVDRSLPSKLPLSIFLM